jgi:hypothetical protein
MELHHRRAQARAGRVTRVDRLSGVARAEFERALAQLLTRFGASDLPVLALRINEAVDGMIEALVGSAQDGASLSPLDVVRIRASKLAAALLPPAVSRDRQKLAALRSELRALALAWLESSTGSRFGP